MDDHQFYRLLQHFSFSREGYRRVRKGVKKRLRRHMQELGCNRLACYLEAIEADAHCRSACLRHLSVPISRFMRDGEFWETLADRILPDLAGRFGGPLAVWSAGCACGEEAYSLAICARSLGHPMPTGRPLMHILATDRNATHLARARAGIYARSSFREMDPDQRAGHFITLRGGRRYRIRPELQSEIHWLCCDTRALPIVATFHLILMRNNILTYLDRSSQEQALPRIQRYLQPGGLLVVGRRERLPANVAGLDAAYGLPYIFERLAAAPCNL